MSLLDKFILDLEENGYCLTVEFKETLQFIKGNRDYCYKFLVNKKTFNVMFSENSISLYKFMINKNINVSTFDNLVNSVVCLSEKDIGISVDTHRYRRKNEDTFHFRSRAIIYSNIPKKLLIDQEEPVLYDFRNCLHALTEETNCNFYAEPWKAFKLLNQYK